jgi:hypothetical protein
MAKNQSTSSAHRNGVVRDRSKISRSSLSGRITDKETYSRSKDKDVRPDVLFPTEPTSIPREEIDRAIAAVISRRK